MARPSKSAIVGSFTVITRGRGFVIAAPHGDFDLHTGSMARSICQRLQWSCLVARGFATEGPRLNINRPTEGVRVKQAVFSPRAAKVYDAYLQEMQLLAPQVRLYVELHGNDHRASRNRIEVATAGISTSWARRIRHQMDLSFAKAGLERYSTHIDVLEPIRYAASHNREFGALSEIRPALHIELPWQARNEFRGEVENALSDALSEVAAGLEEPAQFAMRNRS